MWAAPPLREWSPCIPQTQVTTTNPAAMCLPVGVPVLFTTNSSAAMSLLISVPVSFATTKPAENCLSAGAPRNFQLYLQLRNLDLDTGSTTVTGNLGSVAEQKQQSRKKSQTKHRQKGAEEVEEKQGDSKEPENKLSGFDVLRALEKAAAQKMKKKRNGRDSSLLSRKVTGQGRKGTLEDEALADYGTKNVRPLSIKEDWGTRLDELERRLQELVDTAAA